MKQRKAINVRDWVKFFGYTDSGNSTDDYVEVVKGVPLNPETTIAVLIDNNYNFIDRRQVYAVKRKKKSVKVISDERFFVVKRKNPDCLVIRHTLREAEFLINTCSFDEILELGIVARHNIDSELPKVRE